MKKIIFLAILVVIILSACQQQVVCNEPYIQVGNDCCLDKNHDSICDEDNFMYMTDKEKDIELCKVEKQETQEDVADYTIARCLADVAVKHEDKNLCNSIPNFMTDSSSPVEIYIAMCLSDIAKKTNDITFCNNANPSIQRPCLMLLDNP